MNGPAALHLIEVCSHWRGFTRLDGKRNYVRTVSGKAREGFLLFSREVFLLLERYTRRESHSDILAENTVLVKGGKIKLKRVS